MFRYIFLISLLATQFIFAGAVPLPLEPMYTFMGSANAWYDSYGKASYEDRVMLPLIIVDKSGTAKYWFERNRTPSFLPVYTPKDYLSVRGKQPDFPHYEIKVSVQEADLRFSGSDYPQHECDTEKFEDALEGADAYWDRYSYNDWVGTLWISCATAELKPYKFPRSFLYKVEITEYYYYGIPVESFTVFSVGTN